MEKGDNNNLIPTEELMKILHINSYSTTRRYIKEGLFQVQLNDPYEGALFDKQQIYSILGLKHIPEEPFLTKKEAAEILGLPSLPKFNVRDYCERHNVPYYVFRNSKGSKTYFLRSELEKYLQYKAKWGVGFADFVSRGWFIREIMPYILNEEITKRLGEKTRIALKMAFCDGAKIKDIAKELGVSYVTVRRWIVVGCKRVHYYLKLTQQYHDGFKSMRDEITKLRNENNNLRARLASISTETINENTETERKDADDHRNICVFNLDLGTRIYHLFKAMDINTFSDLIKFKRSEILKYRGAGAGTVKQIEYLLKDYGLWWKPEDEIETSADKNLNTRVEKLMRQLKIKSIFDFSQYKKSDILKIDKIGANTVETIEKMMNSEGIEWKPEYYIDNQ